jgi:hypothetical protein
MKLTESDRTLSEICRLVEEQIREVSHLRDLSLPVTLLANFNDLPFPVTPKDPAAYDGSKDVILVNAAVFPSLSSDVAQFALAHEIGQLCLPAPRKLLHFPEWSKNSSCPLPHARTSLQAHVHDKSGSADPLLGPDCTHPYIYVRLPNMTRCPYLYAYAASRS